MDIQWHIVTDLDDERRDSAERRLEKLSSEHNDLIHCTIHVERCDHHLHGAAEAKIHCQAKGTELVASEHDDEPEKALSRMLSAFEREVHRMRDKRRDRRS